MDLDEFSDDGLDDLTDNVFQELEQKAIQFTQAQTQTRAASQTQLRHQPPSQDAQRPPTIDYGWEEEDDDLDTTEVTNDAGVPLGRSAVRPVNDSSLRQQQQQQHQHQHQHQQGHQQKPIPPVPNPRWNPAINPANRPGAALVARPGSSSTGQPIPPFSASQRMSSQSQNLHRAPPGSFLPTSLPQNRLISSQAAPSQSGDVAFALHQRVRALENELNAARGEASILRAKFTKAQQEHDSQVSRLKKLNAEQISKQERMVEAAIAAEKSANTELQFMQRDAREANDRARRKDTVNSSTTDGLMTTPKKGKKNWGMADGFDDVEIVPSPSKGQGRGKNAGSVAPNVGERTPSKGKRKRPMMDSPVMPLEIHMGDVTTSPDKPDSPAVGPQPVVTAPAASFEFLHLVLDHGCFHQQPPTFDTLSRFAFPSDLTSTSFAATIFENLPMMGNPHKPMQLLVDFSGLIISMWERCLQEQFWEPIKYLVALVSFTFQLHTISVAPLTVDKLVPTAQATISVLAKARLRSPDGKVSSSAEYVFLEEHVDTTQILSLLHIAALACATTPSETDNGFEYTGISFWRVSSLDFCLLLLVSKQKVDDITAMLDLLASSSLPNSIGPVEEGKDAVSVAQSVIERVSSKLTETARPSTTPDQRRRLRLAALRTLIAFARYPFGAAQLASHNNALPRLVTCLSTSIDDLYDQPIPPSILPPLPDTIAASLRLPESTSSADLYRIISQCVMLVHTLVTDSRTANLAEIGQKLSLSHGGSQRYLLALGRLAFAEEDLIMEAGIDGEVVEAAHELLEMAVTPDEGEILSEAFGA